MPNQTLKERLDAANERAVAILGELKDPQLAEVGFSALIHEFVRCKFFLTEDECKSDVIFDLAEASIEKLLLANDRSIKLAQGSNTCTNQSSTDMKKVLLSLTLQRALGVKFTPAESADLETVEQLSHALFVASRA